jgi:protein phosphatase
MRIVARTDKGMVRDNNQDSYTAGELSGGVAYAIVCDGMGGAAGGAFASSAAVKIIREKICNGYQQGMSDLSVKALLVSALEKANKYIHGVSLTDEAYFGMGTTAVAAIITDEFAYIAHAGDSRAYKLSGGEAYRELRERGILVRHFSKARISDYLRISIGTAEDMKALVDAVAEIIKE